MLAWNKEKFKGQSKKNRKIGGIHHRSENQQRDPAVSGEHSVRLIAAADGVRAACHRCGSRRVFWLEAAHRRGGGRLGVHAGSVPVCHVRLFYLQRHASRALPAGGHPFRDPLSAHSFVSSSTPKPSIARWSKAWAARSLKSPQPRPIISTPSIWNPDTTTATIPSC